MLALEVLSEKKKLTKQRTLQKLASIYDPIGIILPTTITGKIVYHDLWDFKISWDKALPDWVVKKIGEMVVETTKKGKHTKNNQFESRSFVDDRYP